MEMIVNDLATSGSISANSVPPLIPRFVHREITRHGKTVYYFRRDSRRVRIRSVVGTDAFYAEVKALTSGSVPAATPDSWVYFARSGNRVKIGVSQNPRQRAASLKTGSANSLHIYYVTPGGPALETSLHRLFAQDRVRGEWFIYSKAIRDWIAADEARRME